MNPNHDPATPPSDQEPASIEERQRILDAISTRAYFLWENAGRPEGQTDEFWFQAEQEFAGTKGS